jgi:hypothetical protein
VARAPPAAAGGIGGAARQGRRRGRHPGIVTAGIFGVLAGSVAERTREIGARSGARRLATAFLLGSSSNFVTADACCDTLPHTDDACLLKLPAIAPPPKELEDLATGE